MLLQVQLKGGIPLTNKETVYLEKIFTAVPLMSNDEKDRLLRIAEKMEREKGVEVANDKSNSLANLLSILKVLVIYVIGTFVLGFCMVYFSGVIEVAVEILLYLLCVAFLAVGFIVGGLA
jgi:hypothetical protein